MDGSLKGYRIIEIHQIPTVDKGYLQFFESNTDLPFAIKRFYYISNVKDGTWRGAHAHKKLKQLIFCPFGKVLVNLTDGKVNEDFLLDKPNIGILIDKPLWRDLLWMQDDSVLCVAASDYYDPNDYIRDFNEFLKFQQIEEK